MLIKSREYEQGFCKLVYYMSTEIYSKQICQIKWSIKTQNNLIGHTIFLTSETEYRTRPVIGHTIFFT